MSTATMPPPPVPATTNGTPAQANGDAEEVANGVEAGEKYLEGLIYPPPEIRSIVDKTAAFIAKNANPATFEERIRQREKTDSRFSFLNADDAYHAYYRHKIASIKAGEVVPAAGTSAAGAGGVAGAAADKEDGKPKEPPALEFLAEMPTINAVDLDIIRLTALFTARSGRRFTSDLATRESRNYQFDFLRPSHSLFPYFNRLVEQYTKVLIPSQDTLTRLERLAGGKPRGGETEGEKHEMELKGRREVLKEVEERVEWERWEGKQRQQKEDEEEKERIAFGEIDWQDFIVVSTVEFTDQDHVIELPPPMSISEVENMTIAQKRMASMIMEGKDVTEEDDASDQAEADAILADAKNAANAAKRAAAKENGTDGGSDDEADAARKKGTEIKKAPAAGPAGMKIRKDYVPKSKQVKLITTRCEVCGQNVPVDEITEHMRIELLDPRWKEKKRVTEANRSAATMSTFGSDVSSSLRDLAKARSDIFAQNVTEEEKRRREEEAERLKKLAKEKYVWDGHLATGDRITNIYQSGANLDEQIEALHRAKGLTGEATVPTGPQIGPTPGMMPPPPVVPTAPKADIQAQPMLSFGAGATLTAAPQPAAPRAQAMDPGRAAMMSGAPPMMGMNMGMGMPYNPPASLPPPPIPTPVPSGPFRPSQPTPNFHPGVVRPLEESSEGQPTAKRPRLPKLPDGQTYPEQQWLDSHPEPIAIKISLPVYGDKPEWGCDGSEVRLEEVPCTLLVGSLRDRIQHLKGIPTGRQQLRYGTRILPNQVTLASLNLDDGDLITLQIKEQRKK